MGPKAKLSTAETWKLIERYKNGEKPEEMAKGLGLSKGTLYNAFKAVGFKPNKVGGSNSEMLSEEKIDEICHRYLNGERAEDIAPDYKINPNTVYKQLKKRNIQTIGWGHITDEQLQEAAQRYLSGESSNKLAPEYGLSRTTLVVKLRDIGVEIREPSEAHRIYPINNKFFSCVDTEEKAYWLGFLIGDGCMSDNGDLIVALQQSDADHLYKFRESLGSGHPIEENIIPQEGAWGWPNSRSCKIAFKCLQISEDLIKLGVVPRKSFIAKPPVLPEHQQTYFWRGYVDANGGVNEIKDRTYVGVTGSIDMCEGFKKWVQRNNLGLNCSVTKDKSVFSFRVSAKQDVLDLCDLLYSNAQIYLDRKYKSAQDILAKAS